VNRTFLAALFVAASFAFAAAEQPKQDRGRVTADAKALDRLQKLSMATPEFGDKFWRESKRLADERGPEIIHAIIVRSRTWRGEEGLIFVPLVSLLPRGPTLKLLKAYERSRFKSERIWAEEFQTEFEASDFQEGVRKYSKSK
jgi:hypothetical protein